MAQFGSSSPLPICRGCGRELLAHAHAGLQSESFDIIHYREGQSLHHHGKIFGSQTIPRNAFSYLVLSFMKVIYLCGIFMVLALINGVSLAIYVACPSVSSQKRFLPLRLPQSLSQTLLTLQIEGFVCQQSAGIIAATVRTIMLIKAHGSCLTLFTSFRSSVLSTESSTCPKLPFGTYLAAFQRDHQMWIDLYNSRKRSRATGKYF